MRSVFRAKVRKYIYDVLLRKDTKGNYIIKTGKQCYTVRLLQLIIPPSVGLSEKHNILSLRTL